MQTPGPAQAHSTCLNVAIVVVALAGVCSLLYNTVDAIRIPVQNFIIEHHPEYTRIITEEQADPIPDTFNPEDPMGEILPDDFQMIL